jgi:hypothetical protein
MPTTAPTISALHSHDPTHPVIRIERRIRRRILIARSPHAMGYCVTISTLVTAARRALQVRVGGSLRVRVTTTSQSASDCN